MQRLSFALWFAVIDLSGRWRSLHVTLVNLLTLVALVAFTVLVYGLILGTGRRQLEQFRHDPLASCLWVRPARGQTITPAARDQLAAKVRQSLSSPDHLTGCAGYHLLEQDWFIPGQESAPAIPGRTLSPDDPLLRSFPDAQSWLANTVPSPGEEGVILTRSMLDRLKVQEEQVPERLVVRAVTGKRQPVRVLGVLDREFFPGRCSYVLTEAIWEQVRKQSGNPKAAEVRSGPLAASWATIEDLPAAVPSVAKYLESESLEWVSTRAHGTGKVWLFRWKAEVRPGDEAPELGRWHVYLENVGRRLKEAGKGSAAPGFDVPEPLGLVTDQKPAATEGFDRIALYLSAPDDLPAAGSAARRLGYQMEDDRLDQIRRIRANTNAALAYLSPLVLAAALLAAWNLYVIQGLRAQQKVAEVGMLKAMGLSDGLLNLIFLIEAGLVWGLGVVLGLLAGWELGVLVENWLAREALRTALAFAVPPLFLAGIVVGSGLLYVGSIFVATRGARRASPIECLSAG